MNDKPEECVEEKRQLAMWKKVSVVCGAILAIAAVGKVWYEIDCYLTIVHGDTVFAKDTNLAEEHKSNEAKLKKLRKQLKLEQQIRKTKDKIERWKDERRDNLLFISQVRKQYPVKEDIPGFGVVPSGLFKEYRAAKKENEKLEKKIDDWQEKLDELEMQELDNGSS
jgi:hypothetical protein